MSPTSKSLLTRCGPIGAAAYLVYKFGNRTVYGAHPKPVRLLRMVLYKILDQFVVRALASASIPAQTRIGKDIGLVHSANGVMIHPGTVIGDDVTIFHQVTIGAKYGVHQYPRIGNGVTIGAGAKIIGDVTIGDYAKVGANAVVVKDVPDGATAVGNPARIIPPKPGWERKPMR